MGGFKPSRADIAGSTIVGSDLTLTPISLLDQLILRDL
jgi:hypothetical protein